MVEVISQHQIAIYGNPGPLLEKLLQCNLFSSTEEEAFLALL